jgi:predicted RNA binding protein YcfA (HicA-like mRNA interferase family)
MSKKTSNYYLGVARRNGFSIREGGSHTKIFAPSGERMVIPRHRTLSPGVEHAIIKFFLKLGVILGVMLAMCRITGAL